MESNRTEIFETMKDVIRLLATLLELGTLLNLKGVQLGEKYIILQPIPICSMIPAFTANILN